MTALATPAGGRTARREFLRVLGLGIAGAGALDAARAQTPAGPGAAAGVPVESPTPSQITGAPVTTAETPGASMEGEGYRPVRLPPKAGASPSMPAAARDDLEHQISCPCPCTLDIFTCRTSMPCGFSPRMHADVIALVEGGHSADEILAAFESVYGEQVLMAPKKAGFNWAGYLTPFAAVGGGAVVLAGLMRRWSRRAAAVAAATKAEHASRASGNGHGAYDPTIDARPDELAQLEAAVRGGNEDR